MAERCFDIEMMTIFGKKTGRLSFFEVNGKINGLIEILRHRNEIHGYLKESGKIEFSGDIISLVRVIPFYADGWIMQGIMKLSLITESSSFSVVGREVKSK